jgi:small subunit ribosomal protein S16
VVLTDSKNSTKSGRLLEILGSHDPRHKELTKLEGEKIKYWISKGAKPTPTLHNMFISKKIIEGKKINVLPRKSPIKKEADKEEAKKGTEAASAASAGQAASAETNAAPAADAVTTPAAGSEAISAQAPATPEASS